MNTCALEPLSDTLLGILYETLLLNRKPSTYGATLLKQQVSKSVTDNEPLRFLLPAFPSKSSSPEKCLSNKLDMTEWAAVKKIVSTIRQIEERYAPGVEFIIFSDFHTFSNYISVAPESYYDYHKDLKAIVSEFNCEGALHVKSLSDYEDFASYPDAEQSEVLRIRYGDGEYESALDSRIANDSDTHKKYIALKRFITDDLKQANQGLSNTQRNKKMSDFTRGMMIQGVALDRFLVKIFPQHIRLSIHHHPDESAKHTVQFFDRATFKTPWHNCMTFVSRTGEYRVDKLRLVTLKEEDSNSVIVPVYFDTHKWLLLDLPVSGANAREALKTLKFSLYKRNCGLLIESTEKELDISLFDNSAISHLLSEFGLLVFRGFTPFESIDRLESWYSQRGRFLQWNFGATHVVKAEREGDSYSSSVKSQEALPFHWDMSSPPPYMDIDQTIHQYHEYTPKEFLLYCHKNATLEGGLSTLIDCTMAPLTLHGNKRKALRETTLSYQVKLSYFGGIERNYPLIMEAPGTHKEVLRWWQMWDEENNPGGVQFNYSRILESSTYTDMSALEHELTSLSLQAANHFAVEFQTGDITLINNHTMLHGRTAFKGHRELWRIQLQPEHRANTQ